MGAAGVFWQTQGSGKSFSMVFFAQKDSAQSSGQLDVCGRDRPRGTGRPDCQDVQGDRRGERSRGRPVPRRERRAPAGIFARESSLRFHADPEVPDTRNALRPPRRDCAHRRGAPQPIRHAGAEHAGGAAEGALPRLYRHAADRRRGTHQGRFRRLRLDLRLPAVGRGRRNRPALLREPHAGAAAGEPGPE